MFLFEEILSLSFLARRKEDNRKDVFVKVGQSLKLENTGTKAHHLSGFTEPFRLARVSSQSVSPLTGQVISIMSSTSRFSI
jgi:hypothetical protein